MNVELSVERLPVYGEDQYDHSSPGLIYVDTSFPGFGVDLDYFNSKCKGCSCSFHCEAGFCLCLKGSGIKSLSDMKVKYADRQYPIFECNSLCGCDNSCINKLIKIGPRRGLCVVFVGEKGQGLITQLDIPIGSFVCEYAGEIIGTEEAQRRLKLLRKRDPNYILFLREHGFRTTDEKFETTIIDPTTVGNIGRYINHGCDPNLRVVPIRSESMVPIAALFAIKDIRAGDELSYDYNDSATKPDDGNLSNEIVFHSATPCLCFSSKCRKYLPLNNFA